MATNSGAITYLRDDIGDDVEETFLVTPAEADLLASFSEQSDNDN